MAATVAVFSAAAAALGAAAPPPNAAAALKGSAPNGAMRPLSRLSSELSGAPTASAARRSQDGWPGVRVSGPFPRPSPETLSAAWPVRSLPCSAAASAAPHRSAGASSPKSCRSGRVTCVEEANHHFCKGSGAQASASV